MTQQLSTNTFCVAKFIVSPTASNGTHTTIASALAAASSGDTIFVRSGTYTENITLKAGVNIAALSGQATSNVVIQGRMTATFAGSCAISNIQLKTNTDFFLVVSGASATQVSLINCYLNCTNNTGISFTSSSASSLISIDDCSGNIGALAISLFDSSAAGAITISDSNSITNTGASVTASTASSGSVNLTESYIYFPITTSGTASISSSFSFFSNSATNTTCVTVGGSGTNNFLTCEFFSGTASALSVSTNATLMNCLINSSNTSAVAGAGTVSLGSTEITSTGLVNPTTITPLYFQYGIQRSKTQPAFFAFLGANVVNATGNSVNFNLGTTTALTEVFDQNNNFVTSGTFTAPIDGRYVFYAGVYMSNIVAGNSGLSQIRLVASNRTIGHTLGGVNAERDSGNNMGGTISSIVDMDAADTCICQINVGAGTQTVTIVSNNADTFFGGHLFC